MALTPQGRQLTQEIVEELADEEHVTLLSARFEGFDERVVQHLASDAISIGPYVLSNGDLPAMVLVDAIARRLPGAIREESGAFESFSAELDGGLEYPHYTRPPDFRGWHVPEVLLSGDHAKIDEWRREQSRRRSRPVSDHYNVLGVRPDASPQEVEAAYRRVALERAYQDGAWRELRDAYEVLRDPEQRARYDADRNGFGAPEEPGKKSHNPVDRLFPNLSHGWRVGIDWVVTIVGAVAIVLAIKAWIVNPYRIPSSSMEPTLHCARPAQGCEASASDRVLANRFIYRFRSPHRGEIVVFKTPSLAKQECGSEGTFVKRLIGLPGDVWAERNGIRLHQRQAAQRVVHPSRPPRHADPDARRPPAAEHDEPDPEGHVPDDGRQPELVLRLPPLGSRARRRT